MSQLILRGQVVDFVNKINLCLSFILLIYIYTYLFIYLFIHLFICNLLLTAVPIISARLD